MHVDIRLNQCERRLFTFCELLSRESVTVVHQLELAGVDCNDRANVEVFLADGGIGHPFQKHSLVLYVVLEGSEYEFHLPCR